MNVEKIRRKNLQNYITTNYPNKRKFTLAYSLNYGNLYSILKGERPFGERLARDLEQKIGLQENSLDQDDSTMLNQTETRIPVYANKLSAGNGNLAFNEAIVSYHLFNSEDLRNEGFNEKNLCVFYVRGDSMLPEIQDGAKVLVDLTQGELIDNKIYAISINNEIYIKKLFNQLGSNKVVIHSENNNYPDATLKLNDEFKIIGKVVYLLGKRL